MTLGEKLSEYRRGAGYSQEELAERLNVSRQAISKWERGEALPDTENLIALADLYAVSIDALLGREKSKNGGSSSTDEQSCEENDEEASTSSKTDANVDEGSPTEGTEEAEGIEGDESFESAESEDEKGRGRRVGDLVTSLTVFGTTAAFLLWGFLGHAFRVSWTVFLLIPVISSVVECIHKRKIGEFCFPLLITFVYLLIGLLGGIWHPTWVMFLAIPVFYVLTDCFEK